MRYTTKTEYGLICMMHLTRKREATRVTIHEIASQENYPEPYIEKILQQLKHAGLVISQQGHDGGYRLAKPASMIHLKHIIDALEGDTFDVFCNNDVREDIVCNHICMCGVKPVWRRTKELLDQFYEAITLEMITKNPAEVQNLIPMLVRNGTHGQ